MKKKKTCILIILILVVILALIWKSSDFVNDHTLMSEEEMISVFSTNKNLFVSSTEELFDFQFHWSLRQGKHDKSVRKDWKYTNLSGNIQLTIHDKNHFNESSEMKLVVEEEKSIERILKKLKFEAITTKASVDSKCIYFMKQAFIGFDSGIVYCPDKERPENPYITKLIEIEPSWYYYESR